jgi:hypothetical protein
VKAETTDGSAVAGDPIAVLAGNGCVVVGVVRIIGADLHSLVNGAPELGIGWITELEEGLEPAPEKPGEITITLYLRLRVFGSSPHRNAGTGGFEGIAKFAP